MVQPGASSQEIRNEIFDSFESKIAESDIDEDTAQKILEAVLADEAPHEFSNRMVPN